MKYQKAVYWSCVATLVLGFAAPVFGQQGDDNDQQNDNNEYTENIVVTAQKREQRLLDVPISIEALSGEQMEQQGIDSVQDLGFAVPGLTTREDGPGSYQIFLRGVANQYGSGALVGAYLDEAPVTLNGFTQLPVPTIDIKRVEVLKGPQGTLYGQGSVAGTIRYITEDPQLDAFGGSVKASLATVDQGSAQHVFTGVFNVPIVKDTAGLRIAVRKQDGGGWIDQPEAGIKDGNEPELTHIRIKGLWEVNDLLTAKATVIRHRLDVLLGQGYEQPDRTNFVAIDPSQTLLPKELDYDLYNTDLTFHLGFADLLSSSTYTNFDHQYPFAYRGGEETIYNGNLEGNDDRYVDARQFTQELRLTSSAGGPLDWTVGGFYRNADRTLSAVSDTLSNGTLYPDAPYKEKQSYDSYSLFGNLSYDVTDRIEVGAGLRYFHDDREALYQGTNHKSDTFDSYDPRLHISFSITDNANVFATYSEGFRSGGFNTGSLPSFDPENLQNYEIGTKASLFNGLVDFQLSAYYSEYKDMLRRGLLLLNNRLQQLTSNIGKAEIKGIEGGLTWRPLDGLALNGSFAVIDSEIVDIDTDAQAQGQATNKEGDSVDYVPDYSFTLGAHYSFDWADNLPGYARLDYSFRDKVPYSDRTSFPDQNVPQYSDIVRLLNARVGLTWGAITYELFGTNLTNENVYIDPYEAFENANRTKPRTVGVSAKYAF